MVRQIVPSTDPDPAGWGTVPTVGGDVTTTVPDSTGASTTSTQQASTASATAVDQSTFLAPAPVWSPLMDPNGYMTSPWVTWFQQLQRRVGGNGTVTSVADLDVLTEFDDIPATVRFPEVLDYPDPVPSQRLAAQIDDLTALSLWQQPAWTRQAALTSVATAAPAGGTGTAAGGWDTAVNRDTAIAAINNCRTRILDLEARLQRLGII